MISSIKKLFRHISSIEASSDDNHIIPNTSALYELLCVVDTINDSTQFVTAMTVESRIEISLLMRTSLQATMTFLNIIESKVCDMCHNGSGDKYIDEIPLWLTEVPRISSTLDNYLVINNSYVEYHDVVDCIIGSILRIRDALTQPANVKYVNYYINKPAILYRELRVILETRLSHC